MEPIMFLQDTLAFVVGAALLVVLGYGVWTHESHDRAEPERQPQPEPRRRSPSRTN
jgi:hypothetical protein